MVKRRKEEPADEAEDAPVIGFIAVYVFDVSQNEGNEFLESSLIDGDPGEKFAKLESLIRSREP